MDSKTRVDLRRELVHHLIIAEAIAELLIEDEEESIAIDERTLNVLNDIKIGARTSSANLRMRGWYWPSIFS